MYTCSTCVHDYVRCTCTCTFYTSTCTYACTCNTSLLCTVASTALVHVQWGSATTSKYSTAARILYDMLTHVQLMLQASSAHMFQATKKMRVLAYRLLNFQTLTLPPVSSASPVISFTKYMYPKVFKTLLDYMETRSILTVIFFSKTL